jgi:hypothetical protein
MSILSRISLSKVQELFGLHHKKTVHLEGGLGSQILGAIYFWNLLSTFSAKEVNCDISYFENENTTLRPWMLDRYGIKIEDFKSYAKSSNSNRFLAKKDYLTYEETEKNYWSLAREKYINRFDFEKQSFVNYFKNRIDINLDNDYTAVHIRRGDYLDVASLLISTQEYVELLISIQPMLTKNIIFVSDSPLSESEIKALDEASGSNQITYYFDSPELDPFQIHCLLRNSRVLICANSTFSFTAGILGKAGQKVFSPLNFHAGKGSEKYNRTLQIQKSFTVWPVRN